MRRFRTVLIVFGLFVLLGALGGGAAFYFTSGATTAADAFFQTLAAQGPQAAYAEAAPAFRASSAPDAFARSADRLGLRGYRFASWSSRSISGGKAELEGTLSLADGSSVPATMQLVKDDAGSWRVFALSLSQAGLQTTTLKPALPDEAATRQLAQVSMMQLAEAIHAKDFRGLHAATAAAFRAQFTPEVLAQQFKTFTDHDLDLTRAETNAVSFTQPPRIDDEGKLALHGVLPTPTQPWYFAFDYITEAADWRLVSISLSSKPE